MTMIVPAKNKAELKAKLDAGCVISDPTPYGNRIMRSQDVARGFKEPVCLDPETRRRFAQIEKLADGTWRVK
jgi:23S rRNA G2445 N2-methylase RlmL